MAIISKKKKIYPISENLKLYLEKYNRYISIPVQYEDLLRYENSFPLYDKENEDTLWQTVLYSQDDMQNIHEWLKKIYAIMKYGGALNIIDHLFIDRVDLCSYGNTQPFRIRIVNRVNDNFDYFYVKKADASRVYGLEIEDVLSPNRVNYVVHKQTLIEEHIVGIPGDAFIKSYLKNKNINKTRIAKEFVKFNERCLVRLLGDMHSSNFVINITPDFDEINYRIRAIDFDQQSYEGKRSIYMPQYFKQNNPIIQLGVGAMTVETVHQYQQEERNMIAYRYKASQRKVKDVLEAMKKEQLAPQKNVISLAEDLAFYYKKEAFKDCKSMGEILEMSLDNLL